MKHKLVYFPCWCCLWTTVCNFVILQNFIFYLISWLLWHKPNRPLSSQAHISARYMISKKPIWNSFWKRTHYSRRYSIELVAEIPFLLYQFNTVHSCFKRMNMHTMSFDYAQQFICCNLHKALFLLNTC